MHIGRFEEMKNHIFLINLMEKLSSDDFILFCAGDGPLFDVIQKKASEKQLRNIVFLGSISYVSKLLLVSDIFVLPSITTCGLSSQSSPITTSFPI